MKSLQNRKARESVLSIIDKYHDNEEECVNFFIKAKWHDGFECDCGCHEYYMLNTRNNVLVCMHCGKQQHLTAVELTDKLEVNYKTGCLFANKCRTLMASSNAKHTLDSLFYESDVF